MPNLYSTAEVATTLGCAKSTVTRAVKDAAKSGHVVGSRVGHALAFSQADVKALRKIIRETRGNPKMVAGNDLWKRQKKLEKSKRNA